LVTFLIVPAIAPLFGRQKIEDSKRLRPQFLFTKLLNRNYVSKDLHTSLLDIAEKFNDRYPTIQVVYLDANFPFFDGFPLLPHLSHNDGKKIDLSFVYKDRSGSTSNLKPSRSGYGIFEEPNSDEINQNKLCQSMGAWQYDFPKHLTFGSEKDLEVDISATKTLIQLVANNSKVHKIFLEPHLKKRWKLYDAKIRFQGCHAVRHDDHIHLQIN
jgi:hypothetical protein